MADVFQLGQEASKSAFVAALTALQTQGAGVLQVLETARLDTLVEFDRRLQSINGRRIRAWRVGPPEQAVRFVLSDLSDIDQANTTGTVRADSASVSLRERAEPADAVIKTNNFSSTKGTIEPLDSAQTILRVHTDDGSVPTGQFDIELVTPLTLNQFTINIVSSPSSPTIVVTVSTDGLTFTSATQVSINAYQITVWLPATEVRFIRMQITPSHPDDLNGNTFTFGVTDFSAQAAEFHLRSEFVSKVLQFSPQSEVIVLDAPDDANIQYYLSLFAVGNPTAPFVEINPGDAVQIGTPVTTTITTNPSFPSLLGILPSNTYLSTISVKEGSTSLKIAPALSATDPHLTQLVHEYVGWDVTSIGYTLELIRGDGNYNPPRTFTVSYIEGPAVVNVQLKARLSTIDKAVSPIFRGATLDEA